MPSTESSRKLKRFRAAYREARRTGAPVDDVFGVREETYQRELERSLEQSATLEPERRRVRDRLENSVTRRDFLKRGGLVGAGVVGLTMVSAGPLARRANAAGPRVVVIGGGLAGLTAAYRINKLKGWAPQVYEATDRVGGRAETVRGLMQDGVYFEECASGISSNESGTGTITNLATEVGLTPLVDIWLNYTTKSGGELYNYLGSNRTWSQLSTGYTAILDKCWELWRGIGRKIPTYQTTNTTAKTWDNKSVVDLINSTAYPVTTPAGAYVAQTFGVEYGGPASVSSAIHQILEEGNFWGGDSGYDERFAIPGGNDVLASTLASRLPAGSVHFDQALIAIRKNTDSTYTLTFQNSGGAITTIIADRVVMANPPTTMKYIDYSAAGFNALKVKTFAEPLGNAAKLAFQFNGQAWAPKSGDAYSDMVTGSAWTVQFQGTASPHMLMMNNKAYPTLPDIEEGAPASVVSETLTAMDKLWPGMSSKFIPGQAYISQHAQDKWTGGCYSYRGLGGFTTYGDAEQIRSGNVHFAGEHTAPYIKRGTMDGAVRSGERVATEVTGY